MQLLVRNSRPILKGISQALNAHHFFNFIFLGDSDLGVDRYDTSLSLSSGPGVVHHPAVMYATRAGNVLIGQRSGACAGTNVTYNDVNH